MSGLDTLARQIPQELRVKLLQHFGIAKEFERNPETISITYYCLMFIANETLKLQKGHQFVSSVIDYLEATKRNNRNDEIIRSMKTGQETIEELITVLVEETNEAEDGEVQTPDQLRLLMRKHYTVGGLTDVLSVFGPVKENFATLGRIAKSRAVAIFRDITAAAGGGASSAARPPDSNTGATARSISSLKPPATSAQPPSQMPQVPSSHGAASFYDQSSGNKSVPFDVISQAQKLCRDANSSLEYESVSTAVKNCEQLLQLLRPYHNCSASSTDGRQPIAEYENFDDDYNEDDDDDDNYDDIDDDDDTLVIKTSYAIENSSPSVDVFKGNLITQQSDAIVVCSSSQYLFNTICEAGGDSVLASYNAKLNKKSEAPIIAVQADGQIASQRIYFLPWQANSDTSILSKSIEKFVSDAIEKAVEERCHSIAFPAIGCGQYGCSIDLVAQAMVREAYRQFLIHNMSISFVIQPERADIFDEFQKQINLIQPQSSSNKLSTASATVGKGTIEVEKGDITMEKVDVIIGSSSSEFLRKIIIMAAGKEVQTAYDVEYENNPNSILIVTPPGALHCKRIFFIKWEPAADEEVLQQSLIDLIWAVIQYVSSHKFTSIAFPAIGCGEHGCSIQIVVKTMVLEMKKQLIKRNLPWKVKFVIQPDQPHTYDEFCKHVLTAQDDIHDANDYQLPSTWEKSTENKMRFVLSPTTEEYKSIVSNFDQAMKGNYTQIIRIERIQNERCYMQYLAHCKDFKKRLNMDFEKRLYHGCPEHTSDSIINGYFNRSFAGVNGTVYGKGVYFSSNAAYSHGYATANTNGERCMFVARILAGKTVVGNNSMITPPVGFDSTTDGNHIFVTYHDAQALAEYLITYK